MTLVLSQADVRTLLPMKECIDVMERALKTLAQGESINPLRRGIRLSDPPGILGMMPGYLSDPPALGLKVVTVFPDNHGTEYDSHQGVVMLFELEHGRPLVIMDASEVTAIRTAAVTAVATDILANRSASQLAILGTGVQARTHLEAISLVRPIERMRVYSRDPERRQAFAREATNRYDFPVTATQSAREAIAGAEIICTTTSSVEPVLFGDWIEPGTHVNAVGSSVKHARELDAAAVAKSRLFVDRKESTINESGDYLSALNEGAITESHIVGEIGDILAGTIRGREAAQEITLFKSLGLAIEDLASAHHVYQAARAQGRGVDVDLGGKVN